MKLNVTIEKRLSIDFDHESIADYVIDSFTPDIANTILSELEELISSESDDTISFSELDENIKKEMYTRIVSDVIAKMPRVYDEYM